VSPLDAIDAGNPAGLPPRSQVPKSAGDAIIVAEVSFDTPARPAELAAIERSCTWCFEAYRVKLVRSYLARNRSRAVLVFRAPDAESVRLACRHASLVIDRAWACLQPPPPGPP